MITQNIVLRFETYKEATLLVEAIINICANYLQISYITMSSKDVIPS